jgi:photosynthetic reaction center cytochrome c subunit
MSMKLSRGTNVSRRTTPRATRIVFVCVLAFGAVVSAAARQEKPPMADDVFKNIQVLRGLTVDEFMGTMGFISASLSMNCSDCHDPTNAAAYAADNPRKQVARRMIVMVDGLNKANFGGRRVVTCYSCHRGADRPKITPSLAEQYGTPPEDDPNEVEIPRTPRPNAPSVDQVLDRYIQALGGTPSLASLNSFVGRGTYEGFDTLGETVPVDLYAKSPNQRATVVHLASGADNVRVFDGQNAWNTSSGTLMPIPVVQLTAGELEGAKLDAALSFPGQIKELFKDWRSGFPSTVIDDKPVDVLQGMMADNTPAKFYFDRETGLLVRLVRYTNTRLGLNPTQIDYADYRTVSGVKLPFKITTTWTDGQSIIALSELHANAPIDAARFAKPMPQAR